MLKKDIIEKKKNAKEGNEKKNTTSANHKFETKSMGILI